MSEIVVGYDGSACGDAALDAALELAGGSATRSSSSSATPRRDLGRRDRRTRGGDRGVWGEGRSARRGSKRRRSGVEIEIALVARRAAEALIEVAEQRDARMIVVGSYGEAPLKGAIIGSTPYKLLHLSQRPVLVVPANG